MNSSWRSRTRTRWPLADQVPPLLRHLLALWQTLAEDDREMLVGYSEVLQRGDAEIHRFMIEQLRLLRRALRTGGHAV
jgi:hypothetical protein